MERLARRVVGRPAPASRHGTTEVPGPLIRKLNAFSSRHVGHQRAVQARPGATAGDQARLRWTGWQFLPARPLPLGLRTSMAGHFMSGAPWRTGHDGDDTPADFERWWLFNIARNARCDGEFERLPVRGVPVRIGPGGGGQLRGDFGGG
jgi:hypothetical protein